jgi:hypothetical protein
MTKTMPGVLEFPSSYQVMDAEEMTYVEGGAYLSAKECDNVVLALGMASGAALMAAAGTAAVVVKVVGWASSVGGPLGWIVKGVLGLAGAAVGKIAYAIGYGAVKNTGITINASAAPWEAFVKISSDDGKL